MFRFFHTFDLNSEIEKELKRTNYIVQLLLDEYDLYVLAKSLFEAIEKGVNIEIVIISTNNKKSMKLVNLCKRLIDLDAIIYWKVDKSLFVKEDYFAIFDKNYLISSRKQADFQDPEKLLRLKNDFFNGLAISSKKLKLMAGEIDIDFNSDKSIVYVNEEIDLFWNTQNAHEVRITPNIGEVDVKGQYQTVIKESTKFVLEAKNKDHFSKKSILIRVLEEKEIGFTVTVLDPILKEFIQINPSSSDEGSFAVYFGQEVKISWTINMVGKLTETKIGNLPLQGSYAFESTENESFIFTFKTLNNTQVKNLNFYTFKDEQVFDGKGEENSVQESKNIKRKRKNPLEKILYLFNIIIRTIFKR